MKFVPFGSNVVIRMAEKPKETSSGLELAQGKKRTIDRPCRGYVMARGPQCKLVNVDDYVYFDKYKMAELETEQGELLGSIEEKDIGGVIHIPTSDHES